MSIWFCPTCKDLHPNGNYHCPKCGTPLEFARITPESLLLKSDVEKALREKYETPTVVSMNGRWDIS